MYGNWLSLRLPIGYLDRRNSEFNVFVLNLVHSTLVVELDRPGPFRPVLDPVFTVISHHTEEATPSLPDRTKNRENMESTFEFFTPADRKVAGGHCFRLQRSTGNFDIGITGIRSDPA